jgi:phytoene dehydrogenase-like protein
MHCNQAGRGYTTHMAYDAIIIGGGHNGLVCAFYLARAGYKVRILEAHSEVGGCAITEEFHPGFRNSIAAYTVSLLQPKIIADMGLVARGYRVIERPISNFLPLPDGNHLKLGGGLERTQAEFERFSKHDADALPAYYDMLEDAAQLLRDLALRTPPNAGGGIRALIEGIRTGWPLARLSRKRQQAVLNLFTKSARDLLDQYFENDAIKAAFGFDAVVGNYGSPDTPCSAYVLLHHVFGEVNGKSGVWGHVPGGMGAITQMMAAAVRDAGVEISTNARVAAVLNDGDIAHGVQLADGTEIRSRRIISNIGPIALSRLRGMEMLAALPAMRGFTAGSGSFRMNVALSALPNFHSLPHDTMDGDGAEHHRAGIVIAPSLDYMDRAFIDAKLHGWSRAPIVEMLIPSTIDDSLAPPGAHVASLFCQQFAPHLPADEDGNLRDWDDWQDTAADAVFDTIETHAPGFRALVLSRQILSPKGLERRFGLANGDIFHGRMGLDQLWAARPFVGHADYRMPIKGLYLCGAGAHPGGGVTGAPGHNCAAEVLRDSKFWVRGHI